MKHVYIIDIILLHLLLQPAICSICTFLVKDGDRLLHEILAYINIYIRM